MPHKRIFVSKSWGWEDHISEEGKVLFVKQGEQCSWHYHKQKSETFLVTEGELHLRYYEPNMTRTGGNKWQPHERLIEMLFSCSDPATPDVYKGTMNRNIVLKPGDHFHVPVGMLHQFYGIRDTKFTEFGKHYGDADSYRVVLSDGTLPVEFVSGGVASINIAQFNAALTDEVRKSAGGILRNLSTHGDAA